MSSANYSNFAVEETIIRFRAEAESARAEAKILSETIDLLQKQLSFTGLTTEELQDIHGLITGQIAFISKMQTGDDTHEMYTAVGTLVSLASLVSKPTD